MTLLPVEEALKRVVAGLDPTSIERVGLEAAAGRVLAEDVTSRLAQPPFDASSMDGYAVRASDVADLPARLTVIGAAAAGHAFAGRVEPGRAARIFTGAPVPDGADTVVIQENTRLEGDTVVVLAAAGVGEHIRRKGFDFAEGEVLLAAGRRLGARDLALAAAMNVPELPTRRRPRVAILATGDELVPPGADPAPDQIVSSIPFGLAPMIVAFGGEAERLGIARDSLADLARHIDRARDADILVTIGGASVGEHDLVRMALERAGMSLDFWRVAMRPGKPLLHGRLGRRRVLGLPGNPVSALLCARVFLAPMLRALLGLPPEADGAHMGVLAVALPANGPRQHYMRATVAQGAKGEPTVTPARSQDSSLLTPLALADCLIVRPPRAPAAGAGERVPILPLDF